MATMRRVLLLAVAGTALALAGCGDSPTSPSGSGGVSVQGVLLGQGAAFTASSAGGSAKAGPITVTIEGTSISTTITGNGTFEFDGLAPGTYTLVFTRDGVEIGRLTFTAGDGVEVRIVVKMEDSVVVLVDLELRGDDDDGDPASQTCLIEGGRAGERIELEGDVRSGGPGGFVMVAGGNRSRDKGVTVNTSAGTSFKCNGKDTDDCMGTVGPGAKVHVRGTLAACTLDEAEIDAAEVKVQKAGS